MINILITIFMCILVAMYSFIGYDTYVVGNLHVAGYFMVGVTVLGPIFGFCFGLYWRAFEN